MNEAIVIGSGAGGAMCAKELQGRFQVTILEAGREFRPFAANLSLHRKTQENRAAVRRSARSNGSFPP